MKKLAKYNSETGMVTGYFIKGETYFGNVIDEVTKTIDGHPYIEIDESEQVLGKDMCVVNGVYQEYVTPDSVLLEQAQKEKIAQIKNTAESLILATYSTHKQRNTLMSENSQAIQTMDFFISKIRTKSNELEAALGLLSDPEEIRNFPIQFTF